MENHKATKENAHPSDILFCVIGSQRFLQVLSKRLGNVLCLIAYYLTQFYDDILFPHEYFTFPSGETIKTASH